MIEMSTLQPPPSLRELLKEKTLWGLCLLGIVFFHRPLFFDEVFFYRDLTYYFLPLRQFVADFLQAGQWPLWNPYFHAGVPFAGDPTTLVLYPSTLLTLILPPFKALTVELILHVLAAAAVVYLLARRLGLGTAAAVLAGVIYGYCGYTLSQINPGRIFAVPYLPLMLLFWDLLRERHQTRWFVATATTGALLCLTPAPDFVALSFVTLLGWELAQTFVGRRELLRRLGIWGLLSLCAAGLAALQIVPMLELVGESGRGQGIDLSVAGGWSLDPRRLPELVVPGFIGPLHHLEPTDYWGHQLVSVSTPYMQSLYCGALVLWLASVGALLPGPLSRRLRVFLSLLAILGATLSLGRFLPFFELAYATIPGLQLFRFPIKFLGLAILPLALLAAAGAEALLATSPSRRRPRLIAGAWTLSGFCGLCALLLKISPAVAERLEFFFFEHVDPAMTAGWTSGLLQTAGVLALAALVPRQAGGRQRRGVWALAALVTFDLLLAGLEVNVAAPRATLTQEPPILAWARPALAQDRQTQGRLYRPPHAWPSLPAAPSPDVLWRHVWLQQVLGEYTATAYRIPQIFHDDPTSLAPVRITELRRLLNAFPWDQRLPFLAAAAVSVFVTQEPIDVAGVELLTSIPNLSGIPAYVYRYPAAAERAELVTFWRRVPSPKEALRGMLSGDFDPRRNAVVEGEEAPTDPVFPCREPGRLTTEVKEAHRRIFSVVASCRSLLVLSEGYYPGFEAWVDDQRVPLLRANYAFSAIYLEPGQHRVEWRFVPRTLTSGMAFSAFVALVLVAAGIVRRRYKPATK
jgi:hypothetical protein